MEDLLFLSVLWKLISLDLYGLNILVWLLDESG